MQDKIYVTVRVKPNRKRHSPPRLVTVAEGQTAVEIALKAPPVDGKANAALIELLADTLDVRRTDIAFVSGETSRLKRLVIVVDQESKARVSAWLDSLSR